jgi:peptidyl-prolyl cis-trans isomerase SurA
MRNLVTAIVLALACGAAHGQRTALVDRIVAVVNRDVVTLSELAERGRDVEQQLRRQGTPLPERAILERQILERLVLEKAQLQFAAEIGIRVDEVQLDRAIERIAESNGMTLAAFRQALEKDGVAFDKFREEVRQQIVLNRLREREVDDRIEVGEREVELYLEQAGAAGAERGEYNIAHIIVRLPEQASPERIEAARARAEKARQEALAGSDFGKLAASFSDAPDALRGGAMGWRAEDRLPELYASALKTLKPGAISAVLRSPAGFHLVKLIDRRGAGPDAPVPQARVRHILVKTSELVSEAEARRRLADLRERIVAGGADFAELARLHSQDATAARGGDMDWIFQGDTVPEFERAMNELKVGELSQPVKTAFGWHLIQVLQRREAGLTPERRRLQARQALRERKADEAYQEWLRQLRDRAYVEIRLDER